MSGHAFDRLSVLLVDDNHFMRGVLHTLLQALGVHRIYDATDGSAALKRLRNTPVDLVICDCETRPMDGLALTRTLRADTDPTRAMLPVILLSGHDDEARAAAARDAGVSEFLIKPLTPRTLYLRLLAAIETPRPFVRTASYYGPSRRRRARSPADGMPRDTTRYAGKAPVTLRQLSDLIDRLVS